MEAQKTTNSQSNPKNANAGGIMITALKLYYRAIVTKTA
jgi:hypothetical protein